MTHDWILLMILAAVSHAGWNFFLKQSENKTAFLWLLRTCALGLFAVIGAVLNQGRPLAPHWALWGAGSAALHCLYSLFLIRAYAKSELAQAYPIARGTALLLTVVVGWGVLREDIGRLMILGTVLIVAGILLLYIAPPVGPGRSATVLGKSPWPILVGCCIAGYSVFDKLAVARVPPIALNIMQNTGQVFVLGLIAFKRQGAAVILGHWRKNWPKALLSGFCVGLAYVLVLVAMKSVPVSRVAPVRESSVLFGAILGFVFLKEAFTVRKIAGAVCIFLGVVLVGV